MTVDIEVLKTELLERYSIRLDRLFEEVAPNKELHLTEIEEAALQIRKGIGEEITQTLVNSQGQAHVVEACCPSCGNMMHNKGRKKKYIKTRSGEVILERPYYYCKLCQTGHFPPG